MGSVTPYFRPNNVECVIDINYAGDHVSLCPVLLIGVRMVQNTDPGNAWVCPALQLPMLSK